MNNQDPWSQYEVKTYPQAQAKALVIEEPQGTVVDEWAQYETSPKQEEGFISKTARGIARVGSRIGEAVLGFPEDLRQILGRGVIAGAEKIAGREIPSLRERLEKAKQAPSSFELREKTKEMFGGYTEPTTEGEAKADEFFTDLALLALPAPGGKVNFFRALGTDVAGHLAKEGIEKFGADETTGDLTKLGTFFLAGMITPGQTAKNFTEQLYKKRNASLPKGADIESSKLVKDLERLKVQLEKGVPGPKEKSVINPIDQLLKKSQSGRIEIEELTTAKKQINEKIGEVILKEGIKPKDARQAFKPLGRIVENTIEQYGKTQNPEFLKLHKSANEAFGAIEESKKVTRFLADKVPIKSKLVAGLLFEAAALGPVAAIKTAAGVGAAFTGAKAFELLHRIKSSPVLRKHYMNVINASIKGNAAVAAKNLKILDKEIQKEDPELYQEMSKFIVK